LNEQQKSERKQVTAPFIVNEGTLGILGALFPKLKAKSKEFAEGLDETIDIPSKI
jgi:hypothetical protein